MTSEQATSLLDTLRDSYTALQAIGTELARCAYWLEICAFMLTALVFFSAIRRYVG